MGKSSGTALALLVAEGGSASGEVRLAVTVKDKAEEAPVFAAGALPDNGDDGDDGGTLVLRPEAERASGFCSTETLLLAICAKALVSCAAFAGETLAVSSAICAKPMSVLGLMRSKTVSFWS